MLTDDKKRLTLFENGIKIDQNLPKWVNAKKRAEAAKGTAKEELKPSSEHSPFIPSYRDLGDGDIEMTFPETSSSYKLRDDVYFDEVAAANLRELSQIVLKKKIYNVTSGYVIHNNWGNADSTPRPIPGWQPEGGDKKKDSFFNKIAKKFKKKDKAQSLEDGIMTAAEFFLNVKLATKDSAEKYRDRVANYLKAIHNAKAAGQTALIESLLKKMIANKYESLLDAEGFYYVIDEEDVVRFAKKTEKGLKLSYIENFARPIPEDVVEKIGKANELEVFDNYVVLYYDPKGEIYKETEQQRAKRKDPILFGLISGSNKLYYVADWIDEYCDLTLDKFVDTLKITKDSLKIFKD
jgi:hypothetical protein